MAAKPKVPEVRQCRNPDDAQFGAVAVSAGGTRWGVMNPNNGGHWAEDAEVADWTVLP
jgi:hypothetical protein